jgi:hypothetical protein
LCVNTEFEPRLCGLVLEDDCPATLGYHRDWTHLNDVNVLTTTSDQMDVCCWFQMGSSLSFCLMYRRL